MNTPIFDFLLNYSSSHPLRAHMPGHKGISLHPVLDSTYALDLTEIAGADSLFEAEGIIMESEKNAAKLFGTAETVYSCGGSTLCIQAMLYLMKQENRRIIAGRTVHRAFLNACVLLGLDVAWVYPSEENGILSGDYSTSDFEAEIKKAVQNGEKVCVYITSPDYMGHMADIKSLSEVCRKYDAPLLVDNAHGAHLAFFRENIHPIALGADLCCDSAHKMLPCLTGTAYLHTSSEKYRGRLKGAMSMFASTSPSYLMLASLDLCNDFLEKDIRTSLAAAAESAEEMKKRLSGKYIFTKGGDPLHIVIDTAAMGTDGRELADNLQELGCFAEYTGREAVVLLLSASEKPENISRLERILIECPLPERTEKREAPPAFPKPVRKKGIREAALSESEFIRTEDAEGRICAASRVPCPPAVPIVISGELIDQNAIETLLYYGIDRTEVIKE